MSATPSAGRNWTLGQLSFVVLMLGLTGLFITLGIWQAQRLGEKEALIALVEERFEAAPVPFPPAEAWPGLAPDSLDYRPLSAEGRFLPLAPVPIFTNLNDAAGRYGGVGYWIMAPFQLSGGGIVWVNRGFVPEALVDQYASAPDVSAVPTAIEGVARRPEQSGSFTPAPDTDRRREWVRDPVRLTAFLDQPDQPIAPVTLDLRAGPAGALPQGGETMISFSNRHLEYAGTWFLFAAITPIMLGIWLWRQRRPENLAPGGREH